MEVCVGRRSMYVGEGGMSEGGVCGEVCVCVCVREGGGACVREKGHV